MTTQQVQIFTSADGETELQVALDQESVWLSQAQMAELFGTKRPAITKHLSNIFKSGELVEETTCSILEHVAEHGQSYRTRLYINNQRLLSSEVQAVFAVMTDLTTSVKLKSAPCNPLSKEGLA